MRNWTPTCLVFRSRGCDRIPGRWRWPVERRHRRLACGAPLPSTQSASPEDQFRETLVHHTVAMEFSIAFKHQVSSPTVNSAPLTLRHAGACQTCTWGASSKNRSVAVGAESALLLRLVLQVDQGVGRLDQPRIGPSAPDDQSPGPADERTPAPMRTEPTTPPTSPSRGGASSSQAQGRGGGHGNPGRRCWH